MGWPHPVETDGKPLWEEWEILISLSKQVYFAPDRPPQLLETIAFMKHWQSRIAILFLRLLARLPLAVSRPLGTALGGLVWLLQLKAARHTRTNLQLCFPDLSLEKRRKLGKRSLQETVKTFLEIAGIWEWPPARALALVKSVEGEELIREAHEQGRGVIVLGPHLGNWEMAGLYIASHYPMASLYRPPRMKELEDYMSSARARTGAELVPTTNRGVARLLTLLRGGAVVGILPDQVPPPESATYAPFFGVDASTMTLVSRLAARTDALVVCAYALRVESPAGFRLVIRRARPGIGASDTVSAVAALNASIEDCIADAPEQYQWAYKRFRQRPPGRPRLYS